jgi:uncharacterized protein (DUF433 family)
MATTQSVINIDLEIMSGEPVFMGTRVPVDIFWEYLEGGYSLDEFLAQYPSVQREHCIALVSMARERVMSDARAATPPDPSQKYARAARAHSAVSP